MGKFKELLSQLGEELDKAFAGGTTQEVQEVIPSEIKIGKALINGAYYDLFIYETWAGAYLYQQGESFEAPIGRTKGFLKQDFVTLTANIDEVMKRIGGQEEKEGGFWFNEAAPKLSIGA